MNHLRWQLLIALFGVVLVGGVLFGRVSEQSVERSVPAVGGAYSEAVVGRPQRLNPLLDSYSQVDRDLDRLIFSGLVKFDSAGMPVPDLSEGWTITPDGTIYTFALRPGLVWQDGEPLTSADVVFTFKLLQDPTYPGPADLAAFWKQVQITRIDDLKVGFKLPEPFAPFLDYTAVGLLPKHLLDGIQAKDLPDLAFNIKPVGSGPFVLDHMEVVDGQITNAVLAPSPNYHGQRPFLNRLEIRFYQTTVEAFAAYQRGEVQGISQLTNDQVPAALANPDLRLYSGRLPEFGVLYLNLKNDDVPWFQEKKVRQALLAGLNRQWMIDHILHGQAFMATGPVLPGTWAYNPNLQAVEYDPARAAELLDDVGWMLPENVPPGAPEYVRQKNGKIVSFTIVTLDDAAHVAIATAIQSDWAKLGIQTGVKAVSAAELKADYLEPRAFQAALVDVNLSRYPDPDPYPFWHQTQKETGQNYAGLDDLNISQLLEQARVTPNTQDRAKLYRSFQSRFMDQVPALLLFYPIYNHAVDVRVQNVSIGPLIDPSDRFANVSSWYVVTRRTLSDDPAATDTP